MLCFVVQTWLNKIAKSKYVIRYWACRLPDLKGKVDPEMIYTGNLRGAKATDTYTLHGGGSEGYMCALP